MNTTKKLICILIAGATLVAAAPVFADSSHERGFYHHRHHGQYRDHDRRGQRDFDRHHLVVVQRPYVVARRHYIVERPVYYSQPAPVANLGLGAIIGAAIGGYIDSRQ